MPGLLGSWAVQRLLQESGEGELHEDAALWKHKAAYAQALQTESPHCIQHVKQHTHRRAQQSSSTMVLLSLLCFHVPNARRNIPELFPKLEITLLQYILQLFYFRNDYNFLLCLIYNLKLSIGKCMYRNQHRL